MSIRQATEKEGNGKQTEMMTHVSDNTDRIEARIEDTYALVDVLPTKESSPTPP